MADSCRQEHGDVIVFGSLRLMDGDGECGRDGVFGEYRKRMVMRCHYTSVVDGFVGIAIALIGIAYLLLPKIHKTLTYVVIVAGVLTSLVPTVIVGVCKHPFMHCHSISSPVLQLVGIIIALFGVANIAFLESRIFESEDFTNEKHNA